MTYEESAALMTNVAFRNRIKVACLNFATYISTEDAATAGHNARLRWSQTCFQSPDSVAGQVQPPTVMDPGIQTSTQPDGSDITDPTLQESVETTVNKML
jgi:hypothetical protein